jgi:hypothetical protein
MKKVFVLSSGAWGEVVFASKVAALNFLCETDAEDHYNGPMSRREMAEAIETQQLSGYSDTLAEWTLTISYMLTNAETLRWVEAVNAGVTE